MKHYQIESNIVRCPDPEYAEKMIAAIDAVRVRGDSIGGVVTCIVRRCPRVRILSPPPPPSLPPSLPLCSVFIVPQYWQFLDLSAQELLKCFDL
jgi:hypothetical protein